MEVLDTAERVKIHRLPQSKYIDAVRWIPPLSAFDRFVVAAVFDSDSDAPAVEIHALDGSNPPTLTLQSSWPSPSRISCLRVSKTLHKSLIAASTYAGSLHVLFADPVDASVQSEVRVPQNTLHVGPISCIDVQESGSECVTVGEDGRVNLVNVGNSRLSHRRVFDGNGLVSFTAARWASPTEFATGGLGFGLQWWDQRKPGGPASQFKGNCVSFLAVLSFWLTGDFLYIVLGLFSCHPRFRDPLLGLFTPSIFIHQGSTLVFSSGTVFAWDLRWQQQPISLSGIATGDMVAQSAAESEVWEVQYDSYVHSLSIGNISSSRVLPAMICSEDGILAVVEQGQEPIELLAEPCAINSFDIDRQNPMDVICSLEWEAIAILSRP
ncbi:unnamed protein product [Thlaspi arvense]|uniref:Uncharacterized protein n=1 Tax=Thlaspi arvense TaxID=13288 RepID=A0AAU9RII5_THLAR|nr:unnamed protein product [Thlaspi arvense]